MNDHDRYKAYCDWCARIGVEPATFERWLHANRKVYEHWGSIWRANMGRFS